MTEFETALAQATGQRTAEQEAQSQASIADMRSRALEIKAEALRDPAHPYHNADATFWSRFCGTPQRSPAEIAAQAAAQQAAVTAHHQHSFVLADQINPNLQSLLDEARQPMEAVTKDKTAFADATKQVETEAGGPAEYSKLLRNARLYKANLTAAEQIDLRSLNQYAAMGLRNHFKRTGRVEL